MKPNIVKFEYLLDVFLNRDSLFSEDALYIHGRIHPVKAVWGK